MPALLIADDNPNIRTLLHSYIESQTDFQVCGEAEDGQVAIEMAKQLRPDVVLVDLLMPRLNGIETASILKKMMPATKIFLFSLHVDHVGQTLASMVGVDFVLSKQEPLSKLAEHLRTLFAPAPNANPATAP